MASPKYSNDEIARRGEALYDQEIRARVEEGNKGRFLVIDVETGDYEMDEDDMAAIKRAVAKHSDPALFIMRIGFPAATHIGGWYPESAS